MFRRRLLVGANLASLASGVMLIGLTSYVPLYVQDVLGTSALIAGFALAALTVGWPISASLVGPDLPADRIPQHRADRVS